MKKKLIIFTDIGDTIIDEGTEVRNAESVVTHADCIPGARNMMLALHDSGFPIVMVADGLTASFRNMMEEHGLSHIFSAWIISEEVGEDKPSSRMFESAMQALSLTEKDKHRIIMVGNNVKRDIRGASRFGIRSVLLDWSSRRSFEPECPDDIPTWRIHTPEEMFPLAELIESQLEDEDD